MKAVLGLKLDPWHDTGAAVVLENGKQLKVAAISQERLDRVKHSRAFPAEAIAYCLNALGIRLEDLNLVVADYIMTPDVDDHFPGSMNPSVEVKRNFFSKLSALGIPSVYAEHHLCHAASAFYCTDWNEAAGLVIDGHGSKYETQSIFHCIGNVITKVATSRRPGIGWMYCAVTEKLLGFQHLQDGKTMGLAGWSKGGGFWKDLFKGRPNPANPSEIDYPQFVEVATETGLWKLAAPDGMLNRRNGDDPVGRPFAEYASAAQSELEAGVMQLVRDTTRLVPSKRLCYSGGVALNILANRLILDSGLYNDFFIQPAASDAGIPLGAALYGYHCLLNGEGRWNMQHAFLGRDYSDDEIKSALTIWPGPQTEATTGKVGKLLANDYLVAWYQGASEFGPRALGHRSILCLPRHPRMKDYLNREVKHREMFRPFAPIVPAEKQADYFDVGVPSPYMLINTAVRPHIAPLIPAVVHADGTARVESISRSQQPELHDLLNEVGALTGISVLLNTSLNLAGEPIVETPANAVELFSRSRLDALVIGSHLLTKVPLQKLLTVRNPGLNNMNQTPATESVPTRVQAGHACAKESGNVGSTTLATKNIPPQPVRKLCLATCFSPSDKDSWRWLKLYQNSLAEQNMELVLMSCVPSPDLEIRTILLPLWMHGYGQAYGVSTSPVTLEPALATTLAQRDQAWSGQENRPLSEFTRGLANCQNVLRTLLDELDPSALLIWSDILPQSVVLQHLAGQRGVPSWIYERGLLPETLMVEMAGQVGQSELNRSFALSRAMRHSSDTKLFAAAQASYRAKKQTKYAQSEFLEPAEFQRQFNPTGRKLVAALLQYDVGSNFFPVDYPLARIHRTGFESSRDAIRRLSTAARENNCLVVVKPHPLDREDYSAFENENLQVVRDVNLHSLMHAADVVACMASSTQFEALLCEKPILLLARSPLAGKGVAYEPRSAEELPAALRAALKRENFGQRMAAGRRFMDFLLRHHSIALTDSSHAVPTLRDLAAFIAQNAVAVNSPHPVDKRLDAVGKHLSFWERSAKASTANRTVSVQVQPESPAAVTSDDLVKHLKYYSHIGQDAWVAECLGFRQNGFFLDFGAFDGKTISNTLALEQGLKWNGICVEPNPRYYPILCGCRNCITVNVALWPKSREQVRFVDAHGLSSIADFKDADSNCERRAGATSSIIEVDTLNPSELLKRFNAPKLIDFLTLDVEGAEFDVLSALDLSTYSIALMAIEHNHDKPRQEKIRKYLAGHGFEVVQNRNDDFFFNRQHLARLAGGANWPDPVDAFKRVYAAYGVKAPSVESKSYESASPSPAPVNTLDIISEPPEALLVRANTLRQKKAWYEAGLLYQKLAQLLPDNLEVFRGWLECSQKQNHDIMAKIILEEALQNHPEWTEMLSDKNPSASEPSTAMVGA